MFEGTFIGPVMVKQPQTKTARFVAVCHRCNGMYYEDTSEKACDILLWHLDTAHFNPPPPYEIDFSKLGSIR